MRRCCDDRKADSVSDDSEVGFDVGEQTGRALFPQQRGLRRNVESDFKGILTSSRRTANRRKRKSP